MHKSLCVQFYTVCIQIFVHTQAVPAFVYYNTAVVGTKFSIFYSTVLNLVSFVCPPLQKIVWVQKDTKFSTVE